MGIAAGFFFLLCSCLLSGIHGLHGNDDDDASALLALKAHMRDDAGCLRSWAVYPSGGIPSHCVWAGVSCDACGAVIALNLSGMNLSGTISGIHLGRLRRLVNLTLADNSFSGGLLSEISLIPGLRRINISTNAFNGSFPSNFSALKELEILDCFNNNFSGPLPVELSRLTRLKWLHLGGNYFDGTIPPQYGNLQNLEYLGLNGNSLTGKVPPQLGSLTQLQELYLGYYNTFDGGIPWEFGRLTNLYSLDMASCGLSSSLPASLGSLSKLNTLYLQINNFTGVIPSQFGNLTSLKSLDLSENYLTGSIPEELVNLQRIELLSLFLNNLQGRIPSFVAHWPHLQVLFLWGNNLTGNVPLNLGENRQLTKLDVSNNSLTGYIPPNLCLGGQLTALILQSNFFTGSIPPSLGKCSTLDRVRLGENRLTGSIPSSLFSLPVLSILETPHNSLTGSLPFTPLPLNLYLSRLDLSHNRLSGVIPSGFSKLIGLRTLLISDNRLTGEIPNGISHLKYLATLDLSHNLLNGSIPLGIGFCQSLTILNLSQNDLTGEIPSQIANLTVLDYFNVSRNSLSGNIPLSLQEMQSLTSPDFSFNNLSGRVPEQGQFSNLGVNIYEGNPGLCGGSEGMKLPACTNIIPSEFPSSRFMSDRVRIETGYAVWFILAVISFATILLFIVRLLVKNGGGGGIKGETGDSRWKLTTYHKVEFEAEHVLGCLMEENIVGKGGAGVVYKGVMPSGEVVAVKRLPPIRGSNPSDYGFGAEIETLGKIRHRHIVRLLACCSSGEMNLLVYEYMPNGSLADWLHGHKPAMALDWPVRYKVAIEAAKGLSYLHYDCSPPILHRDVKSSNILLDSEFEAHVSDFGLAKALGESEYVSSVAGSFGYIAPEYSYTLKVDEKSDIYSFGIVLLELLSGRRPTDPEYGGEGGDIARWVKERVRNKAGTLQFLDKRLVHGNDLDDMQDMEEMMIVLRVALLCIDESPLKRPTMRQVVQMLTKQS